MLLFDPQKVMESSFPVFFIFINISQNVGNQATDNSI